MKNKVAYNGRCDEARKGENVRNRINVLMRSEMSEHLKERLIGLRWSCSERRSIDSARCHRRHVTIIDLVRNQGLHLEQVGNYFFFRTFRSLLASWVSNKGFPCRL